MGSSFRTPNCWLPESFCYSLLIFPAMEGDDSPEHTHCTPLSCTVACIHHNPTERSRPAVNLGHWNSLVHLGAPLVPYLAERRYSVFADSNNLKKLWTVYFCCGSFTGTTRLACREQALSAESDLPHTETLSSKSTTSWSRPLQK